MKVSIPTSGKTWNLYGSGTITLGAGGLCDVTTVGRYTCVYAPLCFTADCNIDASGNAQFYICGPVNCADPENPPTLTKTGSKSVYFQKDGTSESNFTGDYICSGGQLLFYDVLDPLGRKGTIYLNGTSYIDFSGSGMTAANSNAKNIVVPADNSANLPFYNGTWPTCFVQEGCVTNNRTGQTKILVGNRNSDSSAHLVFSGGYVGKGHHLVGPGGKNPNGTYILEFRDKPVDLGSNVMRPYFDRNPTAYGTVVFSAPSNIVAQLGYDTYGQCWHRVGIRFGCDWAFDTTTMPINFGLDSPIDVDLAGTEQRIGEFATRQMDDGVIVTVRNSSAKAAKLHVTQTGTEHDQAAVFEGNVTLAKAGTTDFAIVRANGSTGGVEAEGGKIVFKSGGSWVNASHLTIADGATIETTDGGTFGSNASLSVAGTGKLNLGGDETVITFKIDGQAQPAGTYSAAGGCTALDGTGVLTVRYSAVLDVTDGTLTVPAGETVRVDSSVACEQAFTNVVVQDGGSLVVTDTTFMPASRTYVFELGTGASVSLPAGVEYFCRSVKLAGVAQNGWVPFGSGRVYANGTGSTLSTWKNLSSGDPKLNNSANWDTLPDFTSGTANLKFADVDPDFDPLLHDDIFVKGLTFGTVPSKSGAYFVIGNPSGENHRLVLGPEGIVHDNYGRFHDIDVPVYLLGDQIWQSNGSDMYLGAQAPLHDYLADSPSRVTLTGTGGIWLQGSGGTFSGTLDVQSGSLNFYYNDVLPAAAKVSVATTGQVRLQNTRVNASVDMAIASTGWKNFKMYDFISSSEWTGPINYTSSSSDGFAFGLKTGKYCETKMTLSGGVTGAGWVRIGVQPQENPKGECHMGTFVVTNKPWKTTGRVLFVGDSNLTPEGRYAKLVLAAAGNEFAALGYNTSVQPWNYCDIETTVDWAFDKSDMTAYLGNGTHFDLCGTDQRIGTLIMNSEDITVEAQRVAVTNSSAKAATLYVNQTECDWTEDGDFGGKLNLDISGNKTMTINRPSAATGSLAVHGSAKLALAAGGTWKNLTELTVTDDAQVSVAASQAFGRKPKAIVRLASLNSLSLAAGVQQAVLELWVGGVKQPMGDYACGDGTLSVGPWGMRVIVR